MTSFDYTKAWNEYIRPEFVRIYPHIQKAYDLTALHADKIRQVRGSHNLAGIPIEVLDEFKKLNPETLAYHSLIVYYYGHFSPCKTAQKDGLYWKFKIIADEFVSHSSLLINAHRSIENELEQYFKRSSSVKDYYRELKL